MRPASLCSGGASDAIRSRTGAPVTIALRPAIRLAAPSKPHSTLLVMGRSTRIESWGEASAFSNANGTRRVAAAAPAGTAT